MKIYMSAIQYSVNITYMAQKAVIPPNENIYFSYFKYILNMWPVHY